MREIVLLLTVLVVYGVPVALVVRWASRVRHALESRSMPDDLPTRAQFERLSDRLDSLAAQVDSVEESQRFLERLLQAPSRNEAVGTTEDGSDR